MQLNYSRQIIAILDLPNSNGESATRTLNDEFGAGRALFFPSDVTNFDQLEGKLRKLNCSSNCCGSCDFFFYFLPSCIQECRGSPRKLGHSHQQRWDVERGCLAKDDRTQLRECWCFGHLEHSKLVFFKLKLKVILNAMFN